MNGVTEAMGQLILAFLAPEMCNDFNLTSGTDFGMACEVVMEATSTPCEYEDSTGCYWNANIRGNGLGLSFVAFEVWDETKENETHLLIYEDRSISVYID